MKAENEAKTEASGVQHVITVDPGEKREITTPAGTKITVASAPNEYVIVHSWPRESGDASA